MTRQKLPAASLLTIAFFGTPAIAQKDGLLKPADPTFLATDDVKEILLFMNTDTSWKITREEWIRFMAAEFDRFDPAKKAAIDPKKITPIKEQARFTRFSDLGK
jgi:hypothetical protein